MGLYDRINPFQDIEIDDDVLSSQFESMPVPAPAETPTAPQDTSSLFRRVVGDTAVTALKGAIGLPESIVGIADIPTGGRVGKGLEYVGFRPREAKKTLDELYSPEQKAAFANVQQAKGFLPTIQAIAENPSVAAHTALESAPSLLGGAGVARGAIKVLPKLAPFVAGAIGEGAITAGSSAEAIRAETPDHLLTPKQAGLAGLSGVVTAGIGAGSGKFADWAKIANIETMLAGGGDKAINKGLFRQLVDGTFTEGVLEELPQSMQEQALQNVALGKPWHEGVAESGAQGMITGGLMGAGGSGVNVASTARHSNAFIDDVARRVDAGEPVTGEEMQMVRDIANGGLGNRAKGLAADMLGGIPTGATHPIQTPDQHQAEMSEALNQPLGSTEQPVSAVEPMLDAAGSQIPPATTRGIVPGNMVHEELAVALNRPVEQTMATADSQQSGVSAAPPNLNTSPSASMYTMPDTQFGAAPTGTAPSADFQAQGEQIDRLDPQSLTAGSGEYAIDRQTAAVPSVQTVTPPAENSPRIEAASAPSEVAQPQTPLQPASTNTAQTQQPSEWQTTYEGILQEANKTVLRGKGNKGNWSDSELSKHIKQFYPEAHGKYISYGKETTLASLKNQAEGRKLTARQKEIVDAFEADIERAKELASSIDALADESPLTPYDELSGEEKADADEWLDFLMNGDTDETDTIETSIATDANAGREQDQGGISGQSQVPRFEGTASGEQQGVLLTGQRELGRGPSPRKTGKQVGTSELLDGFTSTESVQAELPTGPEQQRSESVSARGLVKSDAFVSTYLNEVLPALRSTGITPFAIVEDIAYFGKPYREVRIVLKRGNTVVGYVTRTFTDTSMKIAMIEAADDGNGGKIKMGAIPVLYPAESRVAKRFGVDVSGHFTNEEVTKPGFIREHPTAIFVGNTGTVEYNGVERFNENDYDGSALDSAKANLGNSADMAFQAFYDAKITVLEAANVRSSDGSVQGVAEATNNQPSEGEKGGTYDVQGMGRQAPPTVQRGSTDGITLPVQDGQGNITPATSGPSTTSADLNRKQENSARIKVIDSIIADHKSGKDRLDADELAEYEDERESLRKENVAIKKRIEGEEARFATKKAAEKPLDRSTFDTTLKRVTKGWGYTDRKAVVTVDLFEDLPKAVQAQAEKTGYDNATTDDRISGVSYDGKVYLIHENISSQLALEEVLLHERLHKHIAASGSDSAVSSMNRLLVKMGGIKGLQELADKAGYDLSFYDAQGKHLPFKQRSALLVEEFLAGAEGMRAYEKLPQRVTRAIQEFWGQFRQWLNDNGYTSLAKYVGVRTDRFTQSDLAFTLKGIRNLTADQTGGDIRFHSAWHGSPHDHNRFSTEYIGTGEGAQAYGYGLYFAGNKEVAEWYRDALGKKHGYRAGIAINGKIDPQDYPKWAWDNLDTINRLSDHIRRNGSDGAVEYLQDYKTNLQEMVDAGRASSHVPQKISAIEKLIKAFENGKAKYVTQGRLYKVELAPAEDEYLLWDKPLSEQSEKVKAALETAYNNLGDSDLKKALRLAWQGPDAGNELYKDLSNLFEGDKAASEYLHSIGIRGIKYLDGNSRNRPIKDIKKAFLSALPEDAEFSDVMDLVGTGKFSQEQEALLKALEADDWLGFDYPAQAISAALGNDLNGFDPSKALLDAVKELAKDQQFNYVIFNDADVTIEAKFHHKRASQTTASTDPEVEKRWQAASGLADGPGLVERSKAFMHRMLSETQHFPNLDMSSTAGKRTADTLRRFESSDAAAKAKTAEYLHTLTKGFDPQQMDLFTRKVILDDLINEADKGHDLPFGYTPETLKADHARISGMVEASSKVKASVKLRADVNKAMVMELVDNGLLPVESVLTPEGLEKYKETKKYDAGDINTAYFRHQVLEHVNAKKWAALGTSGEVSNRKRGWQKNRQGSELDINTNFLEAEFEVYSQSMKELATKKTLDEVLKINDMAPELRAQAAKDGVANWRDLIPEGHTVWRPEKGSLFYKGQTMPETLITQFIEENPELEEVMNAFREKSLKGDVVIPEGLAKTLDNLRTNREDATLDTINKKLIGGWKVWTLLSPRRALKYNINNMSGDLDIALAADPGIMKHFGTAWRNGRKRSAGQPMTQDELDMLDRGVIDAGISINEIPDINKLPGFKNLKEGARDSKIWDALKSGDLSKLTPPNLLAKYFDTVHGLSRLREGLLREAAYLRAKELLDSGKSIYWASKPAEIDALDNNTDKAAKLSRELLGDYGNISAHGEKIRTRLIPFWSWMEINAPRYYRLFQNAATQGEAGSTAARLAGVGARKVAGAAIGLGEKAILANLLFVAISAFNHLVHPDEEEKIGNSAKGLHIILGSTAEGRILSMRFQGAFSDVLAWAGLEDFPASWQKLQGGRMDSGDMLKKMALAAPNKLANATSPFFKLGAELASGKQFYPDVTQPRQIRDRSEHVARFFSLDEEYKAIAGKPTKGYLDGIKKSLVYEGDPGEVAYQETKQRVMEFLKKQGKDIPSGAPTERSNALYYYRQAVRYGDEEAAARYRTEYLQAGGKSEGIQKGIKNAHPLAYLPENMRRKFSQTLSDKDRQTIKDGENWYRMVYRSGARS